MLVALHLARAWACLYGFKRTSVRVQSGVVQVVDNLLDGRGRPVPEDIVSPSYFLVGRQWTVLRGFRRAPKRHRPNLGGAAYIFQLPPTKNVRAILGNWYLSAKKGWCL